MKHNVAILILGLFSLHTTAQTRIFLSAGNSMSTDYDVTNFYATGIGNAVWSTDGSYHTKGFTPYYTYDVEIEKRLNRFLLLTGVRLFSSGYSNSLGTNFSKLRSQHVGIPLLFRINIDNFCYLDVGTIAVTTLKSSLEETALRGSVYEVSDKKNIASYYQPINLGFNIQYTLAVDRYFITGYAIFSRQHIDDSLRDDWNLKNNSLFLRDMSPSHRLLLFGIKLGVRVK